MTQQTESQPARAVETVGVIDIGTNSVRMQIAEVFPDGHTEVLERAWLPARLGQDTFVKRSLSRRTMNAAISILKGYRTMLDSYQVGHIRAVATSAVREASNADTFLDRVFIAVGLDVEIIEPAEECRLTVAAVRETLGSKSLGRGYALVADVGGGSALLAMLQDGKIISSGSYALGSIRLQESLDTAGENPSRAADMYRQQIGSIVSAVGTNLPLRKAKKLVAVGGDARFAAQQVGQEGPNEHVREIDRETFDDYVRETQVHSPEQLARMHRIPFADAETLVPALLVYQSLMHATEATSLIVSDVSMRDGLLRDLARTATGLKDTEETASAVRSAMTLMEKFHCDVHHAKHVAHLALRLFDEMESEHRLSARHRLLLHVATLLHEVGGFINGRAHHKHSYYLISHSELFGLRSHEQEIVANVARYHRRGTPKPTHMPYMALPREERVIVSKLAALLRVADSLDRGHGQQVADFLVERQDDDIILRVPDVSDLALERRALQKKGNMFEDIYGLRIRLEEG